MSSAPEPPKWLKLHEQAMAEGKMCYLDPVLGYSVFTAAYHLERGFCCESGCRHCPYGFLNQSAELKAAFEKKRREGE